MVKALVVEDEADIRHLLIEQLEDKGYQVRKADNGAVALQRVKEEIPDIIFVDILISVMDGMLFVSELRENPETSGIPGRMVLDSIRSARSEKNFRMSRCRFLSVKATRTCSTF